MYKAYLTAIHVRPAPGFDNLQIGTCGAYQVLVGKDIVDGQLGVFFETDGQLSEEFCEVNQLIAVRDELGNKISGGMFEKNRKVRSIKIRGVKSEGFWIPIKSFEYTGYDLSREREGFEFDELNGRPICNKYVTRQTQRAAERAARAQGKALKRLQKMKMRFPEHQDTAHFKRAVHTINPGAHLYITHKLHGTSGRYAHLQVENLIQRNKLQQLWAKWRKLPEYKTDWEHVNGSRRVVLTRSRNGGYYGSNTFRQEATKDLVLHRGEILFFELVGYMEGGRPLMGAVYLDKLKDKSISARFPNPMVYSYGCLPGTCKMYVYHIAYMTEDGVQIDLSWPQVKKRARELGLDTVPEATMNQDEAMPQPMVFDGNWEKLLAQVSEMVDGKTGVECFPSILDPTHIEEGVVVRVEDPVDGLRFMKFKNFVFGVLEGYLKEDEAYEDTEESS